MNVVARTCRTAATFSHPPRLCTRDETNDVKRARLLYQSRKRGTLENGLLLRNWKPHIKSDLHSSFTAKHLARLNQQELVQLDHLLNVPDSDWQLYYWITGRETAPPEFECEVLQLLRQHCQEQNYSHNQQPNISKNLVFLKCHPIK